MSKISVIYATKTNHSKKYADAIADILNVSAMNVSENPDITDDDLLIIISGIYAGKSHPGLVELAKRIEKDKVKKAALVSSCASMKNKLDDIRSILEEKNISVIDEIILPGKFLFLRAGHPNDNDLKTAADFAAKILKKL